ncbi:MAG: phosphorybosylanthranilate isomerase [Deltaproteobacteria bacterium CG_4_9_14_3_um_filter_63_12]|nr:MAG: phosphorybosylanthranilate isomerase [Deltaproteobacteria bacterium CG_4_9_14_3_um_filter_63_12]
MLRGFIGVVHVPAMPGDPGHQVGGFSEVLRRAFIDADALAQGGADGIIVENFGSSPFHKGTHGDRVPPHQVAALTLIAHETKRRFSLPVGVNCLRNDAYSALGIAAAAELDFIRINIHTGAYVTDQGIIEGEAQHTLRYRQLLGRTNIRILADVLVKHASPLAPLSMASAIKEAFGRGHADGIIVSGQATGAEVDANTLRAAQSSSSGVPLFIGSGLTPENVERLAPLVNGAIVGSWLKHGGILSAPVDVKRVATMAALLKSHLKAP